MTLTNAHSLVGTPTKSCWSQGQSLVQDGMVVALVLKLEIEGEEGFVDLGSIGGVIFERFHEYGKEAHSAVEWQEFVEKELGELAPEITPSVAVAWSNEDKLWAWGRGETGVKLYRGGRLVTLAESGAWGEGLAGGVQEGDVVILATQAGLTVGDKPATVEALQLGVANYVETLAPLIHQDKAQDEIALVMLDYASGVDQAEEQKEKERLPKIFVKRFSEEPRRINMIIGGVVGAALVVLVVVGLLVRRERVAQNEYEEVIGRAETMITEAEAVAQSNPERAKILLAQSIEVLDLYIKSEPKASYLKAASESLGKIKSKEQEILRVRGIALLPTIELNLLAEGLRAESLVDDTAGTMYFWDDRSRGFVGIASSDLSKVSYSVENERFVRPFGVRDGVYTGLVSGGVWVGDESEQKVVIETDPEWGEIAQVTTFGNNIYLLDRGMGEIWKYAATGEGYAERRRWFGAGIVLDLSRVVDWVVDGDIWLLTASGKLEKYSRGAPAKFGLTGFPSESESGLLVDPVAMQIVEEKIYILERGAKRVVTLDINGQYLQQYVAEDFGKATDIMVFGGKGYVLVENVIKEWVL